MNERMNVTGDISQVLEALDCFEYLSEILLKMYIGLHVKYPLALSHFKKSRSFGTDFRKILNYNVSWKHVQWQPRHSIRTDRWTDM